jgi:hypothetical protein
MKSPTLDIITRNNKTKTTSGVRAHRHGETVYLQVANSFVTLTPEEARRLAIHLIEEAAAIEAR